MRNRYSMAGVCLALVATSTMAQVPPELRQAFKIDPESGCYRYTGDAVEFIGTFRKGSYVGVTMRTLDDKGQPVPQVEEMRTPVMDAPIVEDQTQGMWFGPLAMGGTHTITFMPRAAFGSTAEVVICGRVHPPRLGQD